MKLKTQDQVNALAFLQRFADIPARMRPVAALQGFAGVGKTWLVAYWLSELIKARPNLRVVVIAPTNKAVDVLRSKCKAFGGLDGLSFRTIDSFLGYRVKRNDDWEVERNKYGKSPEVDLIVCDEGSMVKTEMHRELRARGCPLLYVWDPAQLLPIGEVVQPLAGIADTYCMTEVVRQEGGNPIIDLATYMRGKVYDQGWFILDDVRNAVAQRDNRVTFTRMNKLYDWAETALDKEMDMRILGFTNFAVGQHNAIMHARRYPNAPLFGAGETVLVNDTFDIGTEDEPDILCNGELCKVLDCQVAEPIEGVVNYDVKIARADPVLIVDERGERYEHREHVVKVAYNDNDATNAHKALTNQIYALRNQGLDSSETRELYKRRRALNVLAPLRHSFSNTVHKSQGSTYDTAFIDWADVYKSRDMRARLAYVGFTRPSQYLVIAS